jgi:hypothetical protein
MAINVSRVLTGGLLAGLIIIASGMLMVPVVGPQMDAALKARNVPPLGGAAMAFVAIWSVVLGVLLVWLYAAVRPRFGPGPKTRPSCHSSSGVSRISARMRRWWHTASCRSR